MHAHSKTSAIATVFLCLALLVQMPLNAAEPAGPPSILAPGVLLGGEGNPAAAWVADTEGYVAAVDLGSGALAWRGPAQGLPLALVDRQLVVLGRPQSAGQISLLLLDPGSGESVGGLVGALPERVLASPDAQPNRRFTAIADLSTGALRVRWTYSEWPLRGALLPDSNPDTDRLELSGVVVADFGANRLQAGSPADFPAQASPDLIGSERVAGLDGTQFRSADGGYAQVATAVADGRLGAQWRWTLHERSSGRALSQVVLPYAHAPFMVNGNRLIWQSPPITERQASGDYLEQPLRLVATELGSGRELWSVGLMAQEYRGVLPP